MHEPDHQRPDEEPDQQPLGGAPALDIRSLSRHFGPVRALHDVTLRVPAGSLTAVMEENGAGKSTLMRILAGLDAPSAGTVHVHGEPVIRFSPSNLLSRHKVALVPQELAMAPDRTVAENIMLGVEPGPRAFPSRGRMNDRAAELLRRLGEDLDPRTPAGTLNAATQQLVIVARALAREATTVIFDEPTAVLSPAESERLFGVIEGLGADGITMLYVSHRMPEVFRLAGHIHVLRDGRHAGDWPTADTDHDAVVSAMVGRTLGEELRGSYDRSPIEATEPPRLRLDDVSGPGFAGVTFDVRPSEIVGVAGLPDSGRVELLRAVFGAEPLTGGTLRLDEADFRPGSPRAAIRARVAYLPGERRHQGIFPTMSVADNVNVLTLDRSQRLGMLRRRRLRSLAETRVETLGVKTSSPAQAINELSGGNQQKALLARWLTIDPRLLLLDEPTRGVDVGAKAEIYEIFRQRAETGVALVVSSSDLPELLAISDRIVVMTAGGVAGVLDAATTTEEHVMALATGATSRKEIA